MWGIQNKFKEITMKKTLLLSVVASTMIMAGGDIAPVEPVVETPVAVAAASGWDFSGQAVAYTQTVDAHGTGDLFGGDTTYGAVGLQLRAINKDIFAGIGAGFEVSGIQQSDNFSNIPAAHPNDDRTTPNHFAFPFIGGGDAQVKSVAITQAYLTYGFGNTSIKVGRQTLPMTLSPFAYSEGWQVFKNTMEAALVVNTDLPDTTLLYAAVGRANSSIGNLGNFDKINENGSVVHLVTAQNKSIEGLTLTGSYYLAPDFTPTDDFSIIWGDAKFKISDYTIALQGGTLGGITGADDTNAFGAKIAGNFGMFNASVAYSTVDGAHRVTNLATTQNPAPGIGIKSPLYTQMVLNNIGNHQAQNSDWIKVAASAKVLGGTLGAAYGMGIDNDTAFSSGTTGAAFGENPSEFDLTYKTKVGENTTLFAAYVYTDRDEFVAGEDSNNFVRFWARYNF